ncbi:hypothetical protein LNA01_17650 [Companilactobacillus nantensis]|nr:hypothetical protein LNA01_17650 [Companilactobacillus nantensis]
MTSASPNPKTVRINAPNKAIKTTNKYVIRYISFQNKRVGQNMVSFRALRQIRAVIRFWIAALIWFKRKKLCFVPRLCCTFNGKTSFVPFSFNIEFKE